MKKTILLKSLLLLCALIVGSSYGWAATGGFSLASTTVVPLAANASPQTTTISGSAGETWNVEIVGTWTSSSMGGSAGSKYWQMGKNGAAISSAVFSTSGIPGTITKVIVACSSYSSKAKANCTIGGSNFGTQNQSTASGEAISNVTFSGSASGEIIVTLDNSADGARAVYIRSITVTYSSTFTVTYNANGATSGDVPVDGTVYAENATVTVLGNTGSLAKTNYTFGGWNTKADGTGTTYAAAETFSITSNTNLYAIWNGDPYDITLPSTDTYGSYSSSAGTVDVPYGTEVTLTYTPASGKEIYGAVWSVDGEELSGNTFTMPAKDVTVTVELLNYAILPFQWTGTEEKGKDDLASKSGVLQSGIGTDYAASNAPYRLKFDTANDYVDIYTNGKPVAVTLTAKIFDTAGTGSKITVQGSTDGSSFTDVEAFTFKGSANDTFDYTTSNSFSDDFRVVRLKMTYRQTNVAIGTITITGSIPVTVGKNGYATFASKSALDLTDANRPDGLKAYKGSLTKATLAFTAFNQTVPAGTGMLLFGAGNGTYYIPAVASGSAVDGNALVGVTSPTDKQSNPSGNYYFVMKKATNAEDPLAFAPLSTYSAVTIPAGKAYVEVPSDDLSAQGLSVSFEDESGDITGITEVSNKQSFTGDFYNLNGQRVNVSHKGIVIVNGKKYLNK